MCDRLLLWRRQSSQRGPSPLLRSHSDRWLACRKGTGRPIRRWRLCQQRIDNLVCRQRLRQQWIDSLVFRQQWTDSLIQRWRLRQPFRSPHHRRCGRS